MGRRFVTLLLTALLLAGGLYAAALALLWFGQEKLLFVPTPLPADAVLAHEPDVHERRVEVPGASLSVLELRLPAPDGVVFFLHGNAGNLQSWFVNTAFYRQANFDLVMLDYRGYGKSTGRIASQAQLEADVEAVWQTVAERYRGKRIVVYGRSLGSGLAASLAATLQPDLTMLVSPYESMAALAREHYPWVPAALLRYPLRTDETIARIASPILLLHGEHDALIPLRHARALQAKAPHARLVIVPGGAHNDLQDLPPYRDAVAQALAALRQRP